MRHLILLGLLLGFLAIPCSAGELGGTPRSVTKPGVHKAPRPAFAREGGETLETAVVISSLPFLDSGATCDNQDDYDIP